MKIMAIKKTYAGLNKAEMKYINKSLCTKKGLDECIVIDLADMHNKYLTMNEGV